MTLWAMHLIEFHHHSLLSFEHIFIALGVLREKVVQPRVAANRRDHVLYAKLVEAVRMARAY